MVLRYENAPLYKLLMEECYKNFIKKFKKIVMCAIIKIERRGLPLVILIR